MHLKSLGIGKNTSADVVMVVDTKKGRFTINICN